MKQTYNIKGKIKHNDINKRNQILYNEIKLKTKEQYKQQKVLLN